MYQYIHRFTDKINLIGGRDKNTTDKIMEDSNSDSDSKSTSSDFIVQWFEEWKYILMDARVNCDKAEAEYRRICPSRRLQRVKALKSLTKQHTTTTIPSTSTSAIAHARNATINLDSYDPLELEASLLEELWISSAMIVRTTGKAFLTKILVPSIPRYERSRNQRITARNQQHQH